MYLFGKPTVLSSRSRASKTSFKRHGCDSAPAVLCPRFSFVAVRMSSTIATYPSWESVFSAYDPASLSLSLPLSVAQALLLCQVNSLAMDLPETPNSLAAFASLAAGEMGDLTDDKGRKSKGKGKRKKRKRKDGPSTPARPSDPLPDCRRMRLVDYLQPISTMLDACTVTKPPPPPDDSGGTNVDGGVGKTKGFEFRAYDGTLSDFMGLALVEHFATRLPRTLGALFEDFECHPPDALTAVLTGAPPSDGCVDTGGAIAGGGEVGQASSKGTDDMHGGSHAAAAGKLSSSTAGQTACPTVFMSFFYVNTHARYVAFTG